MAKVNIIFSIEPDQLKALRELSKRTRVSQAVYFREGVDYILKKYDKRKKKG